MKDKEITVRGFAFAFALNILYTCVGAYLNINFGMGLGFGIITILGSYVLFHSVLGGSSRSEVTTTMMMATASFLPASILAWSILVQVEIPGSDLPTWFIPSKELLLSRRIFCWEWVTPIFVSVIFLSLIPSVIGLAYGWAVSDVVSRCKRMVFPFYSANGTAINACFKGKKSAKSLFLFVLLGVGLTIFQYAIKMLGVESVSYDFTASLPYGFSFGLFLNLAIIAVGYFISSAVSISILVAGLATYFCLAPILVHVGAVPYVQNGMEFYINLLYNYTLSPALGMLLLSGILVVVGKKIFSKLKGSEVNRKVSDPGLSLTDVFKAFTLRLREKKFLLVFVSSTAALIIYAYVFNFLHPLPAWISVAYALLLTVPIGIIDAYIILKMAGEAGMSMGVYRFLLYQTPIIASGYRGYTAYLAYPYAGPWDAAFINGSLKIGKMTETSKRAVVKALIVSYFPGFLASVLFILLVWKYIGLLNEAFPCVSFIQFMPIIKMFAGGRTTGIIDPTTFLAGGVVSAVLTALTPVSAMGLSMALFLPPSYILPFGIGGLLRIYTDHKFGEKWFNENGRLIATGFIAGSVIAQLIGMMLTTVTG